MSNPVNERLTPGSDVCEPFRDLIFTRLDMSESAPERDTDTSSVFLERHLQICTDCRTYEADLACELAGLRSLPTLPAPEGLSERIMARLMLENAFAETDNPDASELPSPERPDEYPTSERPANVPGPARPHRASVSRIDWKWLAPAAAAVLVVTLGWSRFLLPATSPTLSYQSYQPESASYPDDGQELAYAPEDRILDPEWPGPDESARNGGQAAETPAYTSDDDPLRQWVGF
jgi:hypothetical protein